MELINPLRPAPKKELMNSAAPRQETDRTSKSEAAVVENTPKRTEAPVADKRKPHQQLPQAQDPAIRKALELLASAGIEVAEPKVNYVKHTYEIEEELHSEFHKMYSVLGFKHVKLAVNDALRAWCESHRPEYLRRKG